MEAQLHDVGPVYAVRDYMRRLEAVCKIPLYEDGEWYNLLLGLVTNKPERCHSRFRTSLAEGMTSQRLLSVIETPTRRMGKPAAEFVMLQAGVGEIKHLDGMRTVPGVYVRREYLRLERDRAELVSSIPFVFFSSHALERINERESCGAREIDEAMKDRLVAADDDLAFATISGLLVPGDGGIGHRLVPFGDGLLVATVANYVCPSNLGVPTVLRQTFRRRAMERRNTPIPAELVGAMPEGLKGHCSQVLTIARTYLSADMLRPEQEEYRRLFVEEADAVDRGRLAASLHMPVGAHETRGIGGIEASPRLRALLFRSVNKDPYPAFWEAAERYRDKTPPSDGRRKDVLKLRRVPKTEQRKNQGVRQDVTTRGSKDLPPGNQGKRSR
jgi:hypothetical protein